jgi:hypothetical protein
MDADENLHTQILRLLCNINTLCIAYLRSKVSNRRCHCSTCSGCFSSVPSYDTASAVLSHLGCFPAMRPRYWKLIRLKRSKIYQQPIPCSLSGARQSDTTGDAERLTRRNKDRSIRGTSKSSNLKLCCHLCELAHSSDTKIPLVPPPNAFSEIPSQAVLTPSSRLQISYSARKPLVDASVIMEVGEGDVLTTRASRERKKPEKFVAGGRNSAVDADSTDQKKRRRSDTLKRSRSSGEGGSLLERRVSVSCFSLTLRRIGKPKRSDRSHSK